MQQAKISQWVPRQVVVASQPGHFRSPRHRISMLGIDIVQEFARTYAPACLAAANCTQASANQTRAFCCPRNKGGGAYAQAEKVLGPSNRSNRALLVRGGHPTERRNRPSEGRVSKRRSEFDRAFPETGGGAQPPPQIEPVSVGLVAFDFLRESGGKEFAGRAANDARTRQGILENSLRKIATHGLAAGQPNLDQSEALCARSRRAGQWLLRAWPARFTPVISEPPCSIVRFLLSVSRRARS